LQQRRAAALDYRLQGHPYWKIGKALGCHPSTAQSYVIRAMKDMLPVEKREAVLQMEMQRLDMMQAAIYRNAEDGDIPAQEAVLKIMHQRARYLGLYPDNGKGGGHVQLNFGGDPSAPNAENEGIQVTFVRPTKWRREDKLLDLPIIPPKGAENG
jgi:DNA-binding CsgD family transcriptional regulator